MTRPAAGDCSCPHGPKKRDSRHFRLNCGETVFRSRHGLNHSAADPCRDPWVRYPSHLPILGLRLFHICHTTGRLALDQAKSPPANDLKRVNPACLRRLAAMFDR